MHSRRGRPFRWRYARVRAGAVAASLLVASSLFGSAGATMLSEDPLSKEAHESMQALDSLIGRWALTSREVTADGDALEASGTRTCRWALNHTAIRCDDRYDVIGRVNGAPQPITIEESLFYLSFNPETGLYEYTYFSPTQPEPSVVPASFDAAERVLRGTAWVRHADGEMLLNTHISHFVGPDRIEETFSLSQPGRGAGEEMLEIELVRRSSNPPPVLHF